MTQADYDTMVRYAQQLPEMRKFWPDGQLLDWCQKVMNESVTHMADGPFDPMPPAEPPQNGGEEPPAEPLSLTQQLEAL